MTKTLPKVPKAMSTIVIRNLSDQLVDLVRDRILAGQVPIDQAIRQDALASELGVSKIPLREALTRLEQEGLVRSQANRGYYGGPGYYESGYQPSYRECHTERRQIEDGYGNVRLRRVRVCD